MGVVCSEGWLLAYGCVGVRGGGVRLIFMLLARFYSSVVGCASFLALIFCGLIGQPIVLMVGLMVNMMRNVLFGGG